MSKLLTNTTDLQEVLQTLQTKATATPEISVSSNGLITATAGTKTSTHQLAFQPAKTITPGTASQVAVSSGYFTGGNVMVAGDANLIAENIKNGVSIFGISGTWEGEQIAQTKDEDRMVTSQLADYFNDRVDAIGDYAFYSRSRITTVNFPTATTIGNNAFAYCSRLIRVSFPAATTIGNSAFKECHVLTTVSFPTATTIGKNAFAWCSNLTTVSFPIATNISSNAFTHCSYLTTVSFPMVTAIGSDAFSFCAGLTTVSFPIATNINRNAFADCRSLTAASFPMVTTIGNSAFAHCSRLTRVSFPVATTINSYAFADCRSLTAVSFPTATTIDSYAFAYCSRLTTVSFPTATTIGNNAFAWCSNLTAVSFPVATTIDSYAFDWCSNLITASFPAATTIGSSAFRQCNNLTSLYLTGSSLCTLSNSNAFTSTPIGGYSTSAGTYGNIYVPASLLTSYKTATNWTYFSNYFRAIGDTGGEDTGGSDGGDTGGEDTGGSDGGDTGGEDTGGSDGGDTGDIISFTIDGTSYQAENGMTWGEWVESKYNIDNYIVDPEESMYIMDYQCNGFVQFENNYVSSDEAIQNNINYAFGW